MNDMFLCMKNSNFYNYAHDFFVSRSSPDVNIILSNVENDCQISLKWFDYDGHTHSLSPPPPLSLSPEKNIGKRVLVLDFISAQFGQFTTSGCTH